MTVTGTSAVTGNASAAATDAPDVGPGVGPGVGTDADVAAAAGAVASTVRFTAHEATVNVNAVLQLCAAGKLRCSEKTQLPSAAAVAAVATALTNGDFYEADHSVAGFAWPLLVQAGGLAEVVGGRLRLTPRGQSALAKPAADTLRQLWRRWISNAVIDEMSRVDAVKGQRTARGLTAAGPRRKAVAEALAQLPPDEWVSVDELFDQMAGSGPPFAVARDPWKLYLVDSNYGSMGYDGYHAWSLLEGRYVLCLLFEYAGTLGLFDLEYDDPEGARDDYHDNWGADCLDFLSRYDGLQAVRMNALGAYVFGLAGHYEPAARAVGPGPGLKVLTNLDVVVTGELEAADVILLDAYAQRASDRVWSLSTGSLLAAIDGGRQLDELRQFLDGNADEAIPAVVSRLFTDVAARARQLRDQGVVRLIECDDPAVAALIARDRTLRRLCRAVGDRHIAVPLQHEAAFRVALRKLGYVLPSEPVP